MTASDLSSALPRNIDLVDAAEFVDRLLGRSRLERDDDLAHGEFGLRDPLTGQRIRVPVGALTHYAAQHLDVLHLSAPRV